MIRVARKPSAAPTDLSAAEKTHFSKVQALLPAAGPLVAKQVASRVSEAGGTPLSVYQPQPLLDGKEITGYQVARPELYRMQHNKCCYCESTPGEKHQHVEHFRPKSCYWWLAWTWTNLLFCCESCNEHKGTYFPLRTPECLAPLGAAPGHERCLLLDPSDPNGPDPLDHIEFKCLSGDRWQPFPRRGSRFGQELIAAVKLDRYDLLDKYRIHAGSMKDALMRLREALPMSDPRALRAIWDEICERWLSADWPYVALSRDIVIHHFAHEIQTHHLDVSVRFPS